MKHSLCEMASKSVNFSLSNKSETVPGGVWSKGNNDGEEVWNKYKKLYIFFEYIPFLPVSTRVPHRSRLHTSPMLWCEGGRPGGNSRVRIAPLQYDDIKINIREQKRKVYVYLSHRDSYHTREREKKPEPRLTQQLYVYSTCNFHSRLSAALFSRLCMRAIRMRFFFDRCTIVVYALLSFSHNDTTRKFLPSTIHFFDASNEVFYNSIQLQRVFDTEASKKEKLVGLIVKQWDGVAGKCGKNTVVSLTCFGAPTTTTSARPHHRQSSWRSLTTHIRCTASFTVDSTKRPTENWTHRTKCMTRQTRCRKGENCSYILKCIESKLRHRERERESPYIHANIIVTRRRAWIACTGVSRSFSTMLDG